MSNTESFYRDLGANLATARFKAGLSQADLARMVAISQGALINIELGRQHPRPHLLSRLAAAIGVSEADLLPSDADDAPAVPPVAPVEPKSSRPAAESPRAKRWRQPYHTYSTWSPVTPDDGAVWERREAASVNAQFGRLAACATLARARRFLDEGRIARAVWCLVQALDESLEARS